MNLNLFENRENARNDVDKFIEELKNALNNKNEDISKEETVLEEYNTYERKKIFLDNKSRKGNNIAWIMDENSVCVSEHGDGGPFPLSEVDLPDDAKVRRSI